MKYDEILSNRYSGPAAVISYHDGIVEILGINDRYLSELGMNIDKKVFLDSKRMDAFSESSRDIYVAAIEKCISTGKDSSCETSQKLISNCCGVERVFIKSSFVFIEHDGDSDILYEMIKNVTYEKSRMESLADSERRYKLTSEQINIYNWEYYIETKEMRPCYRCMRDLGLPALVENYPEPAIEMGIFPEDYADMYREMMRKVDSGVGEIEADIPLTAGRVPFRVKYTTECDENGKPVRAFGSATLISETELKKISLDNNIIETLAEEYDCIYIADLFRDNLRVVKQERLFELDGQGNTYRDVAAMIVPEIASENQDIAERLTDVDFVRRELFKNSDRREFEYRDDAKNRWVRIKLQVVERFEEEVSILLITCSVVDDMKSRQMDADKLIAVQKEELETKQELLMSAVDEANRANMAKTEFFSSMSHDIRTPMNAITGFSKLALEEIDDRDSVSDYLTKISLASEHLLNLINDILDMSRIESGKMELSPVPCDLGKLCTESADMIRNRMEEKDIDFEVEVSDLKGVRVYCDVLRFRQIILNLLSNAYKFTPKGGKVSFLGEIDGDGDSGNGSDSGSCTCRFRIKDNGIGMSPEFCKKIWDAYSREDRKTVNDTQGTGLGMAIVKKIIGLMDGTVDVMSEEGRGTEFVISLPLKPCNEEDGGADTSETVDSILEKSFEGRTILLVDDTPVNRMLASIVLKKSGFTVIEAANGAEAVDKVERSKPGDIDLILMDVEMPVMNGYEATSAIRSLGDRTLAALPIIAMTANAFESDVEEAFSAGMDEHVTKPFKREELIGKIAAGLMKHGT